MANQAALALAVLPDYLGLTDQEAADLANAASITVKKSERRNLNWLIKNVPGGLATISAMATKLSGAGFSLVPQMLATDQGIDFSDDIVQNTLTQLGLAGVLTPDEVALLKKIGVDHISPWQDKGGTGSAAAQDFADARAQLARLEIIRKVTSRYNQVVDQLASGSITTVEQAAEALGAAL